MAKRNYIIYADESDSRGRYCGNFFGGVILKAEDRQAISERLNEKKAELNLFNEIKWQKVTPQYLDKYTEFMSDYMSYVVSGRLKVRIMFTQNIHEPIGLSQEQRENEYFLLYYQFIKNAFGLAYCNPNQLDDIRISLLLDQIPDTIEKANTFKQHLSELPNRGRLRDARITIPREDISDVDSQSHVILQGLDVILGAMCFRLNMKHLEKPPCELKRGKRTIAKERLYKKINRQIREVYPNFNIGSSTGTPNGESDRWNHPYRHWRFVPRNHRLAPQRGKNPPDTSDT